jgi:L-aminopeptidase/D-esterase-like protein
MVGNDNGDQDRISFQVGHWTDSTAQTGCTVVLFDRAAPTVVDVRGGSPGTRETDLLSVGRLVRSADAILLTGGSAFGLGAADGVMTFLAERNRGFPTSAGPVPIVPAAVIFDMSTGSSVWPTAPSGYEACVNAMSLSSIERGLVGAGTGATTGKIASKSHRGGLGIAKREVKGGQVTALAVVNAAGIVFDPHTGKSILDGESDDREALLTSRVVSGEGQSTTLGVVLVDAPVDEATLTRCAISAHDAFARSIRPCHTLFDGDLVFVSSLRRGTPVPPEVLNVTIATELAMEAAIIDALTA